MGLQEEHIDRSQLSEVEYEILEQYHLALVHLKNINAQISRLTKGPTPRMSETLRFLENKIGLLFTLIKSSAFSFIVKHQQDITYEHPQEGGSAPSNALVNGILQSQDGTVNVTLDSTK